MTDFAEISGEIDDLAGEEPAAARKALGKYAVRDQVAVLATHEGGGGGSQPVGMMLFASAVGLNGVGVHAALWSAAFNNPQDFGALSSVPDGIGLTVAFDGSSADITTTEAGVWAFTLGALGSADDTWSGALSLNPGGFGVEQAMNVWDELGARRAAATEIAALPAGAVLGPALVTATEPTFDPFEADIFLIIVRLA